MIAANTARTVHHRSHNGRLFHRAIALGCFCTSWARAKATCFTTIPSGKNKWSVNKGATVIATWTK